MNNFKSSITTISILFIITALILTGCSSVEQEYQEQYQLKLNLEQTESGKTIIKEQELLIPELEKALLSEGIAAQINEVSFHKSSVGNQSIILAKDKDGMTTHGIELGEPDNNGMQKVQSSVTCTAYNCQSYECIPIQVQIHGQKKSWTCSDFKDPCECEKVTNGSVELPGGTIIP